MIPTKRSWHAISRELITHTGERDLFHPDRVFWWRAWWDVPFPFGWLFVWEVTCISWLGERLGWLARLEEEGKHGAT